MKSKAMLPTSIIMTVLMIGLISSPMVTKTYATDYNDYNSYGGEMPYNDYNSYGGEMPYNDYKDFDKVKNISSPWNTNSKMVAMDH